MNFQPMSRTDEHTVRVTIMFDDETPEDENAPSWLLEIATSQFDPSIRFVDISKKSPTMGGP